MGNNYKQTEPNCRRCGIPIGGYKRFYCSSICQVRYRTKTKTTKPYIGTKQGMITPAKTI